MDNAKYRKLYLQEAASHLEGIEKRLLALEENPSQRDLIDGLFRHYHSLKGMSASMGFTPIKDLSHAQEDRLSLMRKGEAEATPEIIAALFTSLDRLRELIRRVEHNEPLEDRLNRGEARDRQEDQAPSSPSAKAPSPSQPAPSPPQPSPLRLPGMIKVESEVFDDLLSTAGELFMILGVFKGFAQKIRSVELKEGVYNLEKTIEKLHGRIYATRMLPIADLTGGLPRLVHDMAAKSGKAVKLTMRGTEISVDRAILEDLASPLVHIIRNAVDHGIETRDKRTSLGKPATGSLDIRAYQKRERVVLEISDDGRGIDTAVVYEKLLESGMDPHEAGAMSQEDLLMAICRPGLSTSGSITDTSGRGVGMDVVKDIIEANGGTLHIESEKGRGTAIRLELPRTTSIIRTLTVLAGGEELLAPISPIEKVVEIEDQGPEMKTMEYEGEEIPLVDLASEMGITPQRKGGAVLVVEGTKEDDNHVGIIVDDFGMEMEAYVKSLAPPLLKVWGVSGVTVMGDGRPVFILDIPEIISRARPV